MATGSAGSKLWLVNIAEVGEPQPLDAARFEFLLSLLPQNERSAVTRFLQQKDRERALVSRIMQRKLVSDVIGVDFASAIIGRTLLVSSTLPAKLRCNGHEICDCGVCLSGQAVHRRPTLRGPKPHLQLQCFSPRRLCRACIPRRVLGKRSLSIEIVLEATDAWNGGGNRSEWIWLTRTVQGSRTSRFMSS